METSPVNALAYFANDYWFRSLFLRLGEEWPRIEWVLLIANVVFSSTFLTTIFIIIVINKDLRRFVFLVGTWLFWLSASTILLFLRLFLGAYHFIRIIIDLLLFLVMKLASKGFMAFQCAKNNFQDDPEERLLAEMELAESLEQWQHAALELDILRKAVEWREEEKSDLYEWRAVKDHLEKLKAARLKGDITGLMFHLRLCAARDFCGISNPRLFAEAHMGTKRLVEEFTEEFCRCLRVVCYGVEFSSSRSAIPTALYSKLLTPRPFKSPRAFTWDSVDIGNPREGSRNGGLVSDTATQTGNEIKRDWQRLLHLENVSREVAMPSKPQIAPAMSLDFTWNSTYDTIAETGSRSVKNTDLIDRINLQGPFTPNHSAERSRLGFKFPPDSYTTSLASSSPSRALEPRLDNGASFSDLECLMRFLATLRLSVGRTALCLSGGGSLAMYHMGLIRALIKTKCLPRVVSGTSGGSIVAGVVAIHNDDVLMREYLRPDIVTRYGKIWFPPISQQLRRFFFKGQMMDGEEFEKTCQAYYGNITFKEAFLRTGRLVSIVVTPASRSRGEALILNCINSPDVMIWSAVAASCALPGLLPPHELVAKGPDGQSIPYYPLGLKWIDGSISQDIPVRELASLFNVKQFIVSQVNPHHAPFVESHTRGSWIMRHMERWLILDIKHRYAKLAKFNMVPKIFGQDISSFWMVQEIEGHVTVTPQASLIDWYRIINQPTIEDMNDYLIKGEARTWPHCTRIAHMLRVEQALRQCWSDLTKETEYASSPILHNTSLHSQNSKTSLMAINRPVIGCNSARLETQVEVESLECSPSKQLSSQLSEPNGVSAVSTASSRGINSEKVDKKSSRTKGFRLRNRRHKFFFPSIIALLLRL